MPNWVSIKLKCEGNKEDISSLKQLVRQEDQPFSFNKIIPQPEGLYLGDVPSKPTPEMEESYKTTGYYSWYDFSVKSWGTKWDACSVSLVEDTPIRIVYTFDTAWSYPDPVFIKLAEMFPNVTFNTACYEESGAFAGYQTYQGGVETRDDVVDSLDKEMMAKMMMEVTGMSYDETAEILGEE